MSTVGASSQPGPAETDSIYVSVEPGSAAPFARVETGSVLGASNNHTVSLGGVDVG
jgi:hypothetical protein